MKLSFFADPSAAAYDVASIASNIASVVSVATGQPVYPMANPFNPSYGPALNYAVPGVVAGGQATLPVVPMLLGAVAGYAWKKSALWGLAGAAAGYFLGNMFGSVAVAGQVTGAALPPSGYGPGFVSNCPRVACPPGVSASQCINMQPVC